jgi:hypothetical protein
MANSDKALFDEESAVIETLRKEIDYRRGKTWKIFSWASTILFAITGGILALAARGSTNPNFLLNERYYKLLLLGAISVLTAYACLWINRSRKIEDRIWQLMSDGNYINEVVADRVRSIEEPKRPWLGYNLTLIFLGAAAFVSALILPF